MRFSTIGPPPSKALQLTGHSEVQSTHGIVWY